MANTINAIQCSTNLKNTGVCDCFFDPKLIIGAIWIPKDRVLTQAEIDDIQATLEELVSTVKASRIYPVQGYVAITDSSEEPTFQQFGYGSTIPVKEGKYNWIFQFVNGGVPLSNALRSHNGSSKNRPIFFDSDNTLIGTKKNDAAGNVGLAGIPQEGGYPYTYPWKANDGTNVAAYRTQYVFQPVYVNESIAFVKVPKETFLLTELNGLENVNLDLVSVDSINDQVVVKAVTDCGADLYDDFADELAQSTAWILSREDGTAIAHTVTKNPANEGWLIDYSGGAQLLAGDTLTMAAPTVLAAAPISVSGYESDTVTIDLGSS